MQEIKDKFKELIELNIESDNLLSKSDLREYHKLLRNNKDKLKFYKYNNAEYYAIRNIEKSILAFKKCSEFNDAFEGIALTSDEDDRKNLDKIRDNAMITCVSENKNGLLMFAHYADSYKGFCVEYDLRLLDDDIYNMIIRFLFPVIYSETLTALKYKDKLSQDIQKHEEAVSKKKMSLTKLYDIVSYFVHKSDVWSYENEWRFIVPIDQYQNVFGVSDDGGKKVLLFEKFDCISSIYLGVNISEDKKEHITEIVQRLNNTRADGDKIKLYETLMNKEEYKLDEKEIVL